jgi:chemotaxis protein methyltransferase CheR
MTQKPPAASTEPGLDEVRTLIERRSGIHFDSSRERFFSTRVREHMDERDIAGRSELLRRISSSNWEYEALLERLLTQETSFFRYPAVFAAMENTVLKQLHAAKLWENPRTLRVWSAGCSTGEEAYSIAISIADTLAFAEAWDIEILATDISLSALRFAERGVYSRRSLSTLTPQQLEMHFTALPNHDLFQVRPRTRRLVRFAPMNLAQAVYSGKMDLIFCMNVMIYFTDDRRAAIVRAFFDALNPGGYLVLGHSESLAHSRMKFESVVLGDSLLYRKPLAGANGAPRKAGPLAMEKRP